MRIIEALLILALGSPVFAQQRLNISRGTMCSWNEDAITPDDLYSFPPDKETKSAVDRIMKYTGLEVNFELVAANVPTAVATVEGTRRLILYNQLFMKDVAKQTATNWAAISILAHEIGHHLNLHTLGLGGDRAEQELVADRFSGNILFKMGATLDEAKAAMESRPETKSPYYPKKSVRLLAVGNGWINAQELAAASSRPNETPPVTTVTSSGANDAQAEKNRKAAEKAERDRQAEENRKDAAQAAQDKKDAAKAEKERKAAERAEKQAEQAASSRGCYDNWGRRWCNLPNNGPIGVTCWCRGVIGQGTSGNP
jgi:hypothetical protein